MHHADPGLYGLGGPGEVHGTLAEIDLPRVARQQSVEDVHQRRLAGAVLAHERVHLARSDVQARIVDRHEVAEGLDDAAHGHKRIGHRRPPGPAHPEAADPEAPSP